MPGRLNIRRYIGRYHSKSIFFRNLTLILLLVAVPLIGLTLFTYHYSRSLLDEEIQKVNTRSLLKFQGSMDMIQRETSRIAAQMVNDDMTVRFTNGDLNQYPDYTQIETMQSIMHNMELLIHSYYDSIYVYSDRNDYLLTPFGGGDLVNWNNLSVHNRISTKVKEWYFDYQYDNVPNVSGRPELFLTFYQEITGAGNDERAGMVAVLLDIKKIRTFLFGNEEREGEILFVVDSERRILFSTEESWINKSLEDILISPGEASLFSSSSAQTIDYDDHPYIFSFLRSEQNEWIYATILSQEEYYAKLTVLGRIVTISLILSLVISAGSAFLISLYVFRPIHEVIAMLEHPAEIDEDMERDNELKFIAGNIMESYGEYQHNREEIESRAAMLNKARVRALQAQINPHFLNNTLQLVNWTILRETGNEDSEAINILENLADLVRVNMETQNNITSLEEEAGYAARYMAIQEKRYGSKIRYEQDIPKELLTLSVLKMLIQPLVENAIYHGLKKSGRPGLIRLTAKKRENLLILTVEDNGMGMGADDLEKLNLLLATADSLTDSHIGLINVSLRLRLVFGPRASLELSRREGPGIRAMATIPVK